MRCLEVDFGAQEGELTGGNGSAELPSNCDDGEGRFRPISVG